MRQPDLSNLDSELRDILAGIGAQPSSAPLADISTSSLRSAGNRLLRMGLFAEAEVCLREASQRARSENRHHLAIEMGLSLAVCALQRSPRAAAILIQQLLAEYSDNIDLSRLYNLMGGVTFELCLYKSSEEYYSKACSQAIAGGNKYIEACSFANLGAILGEMGSDVKAYGVMNKAISLFDSLQERESKAMVLYNRAVINMFRGHYEEAIIDVEESRGLASKGSQYLKLAGLLDFVSGELEVITGEADVAKSHFSKAEQNAIAGNQPGLQAKALVWRTMLDARGNDLNELLESIEGVGVDLYHKGLVNDSALTYLIAGCTTNQEVASERLLSMASALIKNEQVMNRLYGHNRRMMAALEARRIKPTGPRAFARFLTEAPAVIGIKEKLERLVDTDVRILIEGESGTGKSFLARLVHDAGKRARGPFVILDCTNLDDSLFESKLFGHRRGSFTGAVADSIGLVEQADGGTLFLDEIGEIPTEIQARLLYTIESQRYRPVGSKTEKESSFRVIAATNRDIDAMLERGTLRSDLFFRLAGYRVTLPALRDRREDIVSLVDRALFDLNKKYGRKKVLRPAVWETLVRYDWPGNVRELNASIERGYHLAPGRRIGLEDLGLPVTEGSERLADLSWDTLRRTHLLRVLRMCKGNVSRAARILGLHRTTLIYKLQGLDIDRPAFDPSYGSSPEEPERRVADRDEAPGDTPAG